MKKLVITVLTGLSIGTLCALPVGNPSESSFLCEGLCVKAEPFDLCHPWQTCLNALSLRIGFYGDYVFNRHMQTYTTRNEKQRRENDIEHFHLTTNAGYVALNFFDRVDLFSTVGASSLDWDTNGWFGSSLWSNGRLNYETDTSFSWSAGARATLWQCNCFTLGLEGQYFTFNPEIRKVSIDESLTYNPGPDADDTVKRYYEWQVGLGLSYRLYDFVPYMAIEWSEAHYGIDDVDASFPDGNFVYFNDMKQGKKIGYAVGVSFIDCERASLTLEGRFANEKALYLNGQFRF